MTTIAQGTDVKPLRDAIIRKGTLGGTVTKGDPVKLGSGGTWTMIDADTAQLNVGVAVQGGESGDEIDIVLLGPVQSLSGATPGVLVYSSNTEGAYDDGDASTKKTVIGFVESAAVLFVLPQIRDFT